MDHVCIQISEGTACLSQESTKDDSLSILKVDKLSINTINAWNVVHQTTNKYTFLGTNISHPNALLKMIFLSKGGIC